MFAVLVYFSLIINSISSNQIDDEYIPVIIELKEKCAVEYYLKEKEKNLKISKKELIQKVLNHIHQIKSLQSELMSQINKTKSNPIIELFSVQRVFNGIGCYLPKGRLKEIFEHEFVKAIHPLGRFELHLFSSLPSLGVPRIWGNYFATGKGIKIAVIDTGIDYIHPDFGGSGNSEDYKNNDPTTVEEGINYPNEKIIGGYDFVGEEYDPEISGRQIPNPDPDPFDQYGHGTHVAGIIAGYGVLKNGSTYNGNYDSSTLNNSFSVPPGVAPKCQIYALKIFSRSPKTEILIPAIEWAIDPNQDGNFDDRVDIINLSLGEDYGFSDTPECTACENAYKLGTIVIASAGNRGDSFYAVAMPASAPSVIGVGAYEDTDPNIPSNIPYRMAYFSSRGPSISSLNHLTVKPNISAPGVWIQSANIGSSPLGATLSGTSMSAPHISGIAALLKEMAPELQLFELKSLLLNNAIYDTLLKKGDTTFSAGPTISGTGRLDFANNLNLEVVAHDADNPNEVGLAFDLAEITEDTKITKWLRIKNITNQPKQFHIQTVPYVEPNGVSITPMEFELGPISENQYIDIPITINAVYSQITNFRDPSIYVRSSELKRAWVSEYYGKIFIQDINNEIFLSVPFYAQVKPASKLEITPKKVNILESNPSNLQLSGIHLDTGTNYPIDLLSFYGIFEVVDMSEKILNLPDYLSCGDINFVGVADDYDYLSEGASLEASNIYFLISTYSPWATPNQIKFKIYVDTDDDQDTNFVISNTYTYESQPPPPSSDVFVSMLENTLTLERKILYPLYGYSAHEYDMNVFRNNTIIIPIKASDIGLSEQKSLLKFYCETIFDRDIPILIDQAPSQIPGEPKKKYIYDLKNKAIQIKSSVKSRVLEPTITAGEISLFVNPEIYTSLKRKGVLCYFSHNPLTKRVQYIPIITESIEEGETIEGSRDGENYDGETSEGEGGYEEGDLGEGETPSEGEGLPENGEPEGIGNEGEGVSEGEESEGVDGEELQEGEGVQENEGEITIAISPPHNLIASDGTYEDFVLLLWEAPENCLDCEYEIFKGKTNKLENADHIGDSKFLFYFDYSQDLQQRRVLSGCSDDKPAIYYYWVRARLSNPGNKVIYSDFSCPDVGWLKERTQLSITELISILLRLIVIIKTILAIVV